ncbi:MAG TPA: hypothetical protein VGF86_06035 [Candidatus Tumulicola sp.]|jgi:hypothetical protein
MSHPHRHTVAIAIFWSFVITVLITEWHIYGKWLAFAIVLGAGLWAGQNAPRIIPLDEEDVSY